MEVKEGESLDGRGSFRTFGVAPRRMGNMKSEAKDLQDKGKDRTPKKEYVSPSLEVYGGVWELTTGLWLSGADFSGMQSSRTPW